MHRKSTPYSIKTSSYGDSNLQSQVKNADSSSVLRNTTWNMNLLLIYFTVALETISSSIIGPAIPQFTRTLNMSTTSLGIISSISSILVLVCGVFQGYISDRYGKVSMLRLSALSQAVGHVCLLFAIFFSSEYQSFAIGLFSLARFIPSIFKCGLMISQAYIVDSSDSSTQRVERIGRLFATSSAAFVISPLLGGFLSMESIVLPVKLGLCVSLFSFGLLCTQSDSEMKRIKNSMSSDSLVSPSKPSLNTSTRIIDIHEAICLKFIFQFGNMMYDAFYSQLLHDRLHLSSRSIGFLFSLSGVISSIANGIVIPRFYSTNCVMDEILVTAAVAQALGLWLWGRENPTIVSTVVSTIIVSMSNNIFLTICQSCIAVSPALEKHGSGTTLSLSSSVDRIARSLAPFVGGIMIQNLGPTSLGYLGSFSSVACAAALMFSSKGPYLDQSTELYLKALSSTWVKEFGNIIFNKQDHL